MGIETELGRDGCRPRDYRGAGCRRPLALAGAAWNLGMVQRSAGDTDGALGLADNAAALLEPRLEHGPDELRAMYGAIQLHAATTAARAGREGDAWRHWDIADATATARFYQWSWTAYRIPRTGKVMVAGWYGRGCHGGFLDPGGLGVAATLTAGIACWLGSRAVGVSQGTAVTVALAVAAAFVTLGSVWASRASSGVLPRYRTVSCPVNLQCKGGSGPGDGGRDPQEPAAFQNRPELFDAIITDSEIVST